MGKEVIIVRQEVFYFLELTCTTKCSRFQFSKTLTSENLLKI